MNNQESFQHENVFESQLIKGIHLKLKNLPKFNVRSKV